MTPKKKIIFSLIALILIVPVVAIFVNSREDEVKLQTGEEAALAALPEELRETRPILDELRNLLISKDFNTLESRLEGERNKMEGEALQEFSSIEASLYLYQDNLSEAARVMNDIVSNEELYSQIYIDAVKNQLKQVENGENPINTSPEADPENEI